MNRNCIIHKLINGPVFTNWRKTRSWNIAETHQILQFGALDDVTYDDMGSFRKRHLVDKCSPVTESQGHENAENEKVAFSLYFVDLLK